MPRPVCRWTAGVPCLRIGPAACGFADCAEALGEPLPGIGQARDTAARCALEALRRLPLRMALRAALSSRHES